MDGLLILLLATGFLLLWAAWLGAELLGEALIPYFSRVVAWVVRVFRDRD